MSTNVYRAFLITLVVALASWLGPASAPASAMEVEGTLLGAWTTRFTPGPSNGNGANIRIPAGRINGTVVQPGRRFGFIAAIVPVTSPPYQMGGVLRGGQIVEQGVIGGGMCSAAVTLFNAALRAGLRIVERHPHAIYIGRYPLGLDATVFGRTGQGQDVVFVNDMAHPIEIRGTSTRTSVTIEIYGIDEGRTVGIGQPRIENRREARSWLEYTDDLEPGRRQRVNDPYNGFESWVTVTVSDGGGSVRSEVTYYSNYRRLDGLAKVGRYPSDPPAGTRILRSEYPAPP